MRKRKGIWFIILLPLLGMVFILFYNPDLEKRCVKSLKRELSLSIDGVVTNKFYVKGNMYPKVKIRVQDSQIVEKSFHAEKSGIFDFIEVGDSISKALSTLDYTIIRGDTVKRFKFTLFCNEE